MKAGARRCPVCWQTVVQTTAGSVFRHWDSIGNTVCPMSNERYDMVEAGRRTRLVMLEEAVSA